MRSITITGFRRPFLFRAMLGTLLANDLAGWRILIQVEPSPVTRSEWKQEVGALLKLGIAFIPTSNGGLVYVVDNTLDVVTEAAGEGGVILIVGALESRSGPQRITSRKSEPTNGS